MCCVRVASGGKSVDLPWSSVEKELREISKLDVSSPPLPDTPPRHATASLELAVSSFPCPHVNGNTEWKNMTPSHPKVGASLRRVCERLTKCRETLHHQNSVEEAFQRSLQGHAYNQGLTRMSGTTRHVTVPLCAVYVCVHGCVCVWWGHLVQNHATVN